MGLVVVVLNALTKFRDNLFKFPFVYTRENDLLIYNNNIQGRRHVMPSSRHAPFQHNFFHEIRTPKENKHAMIVEIGYQQI